MIDLSHYRFGLLLDCTFVFLVRPPFTFLLIGFCVKYRMLFLCCANGTSSVGLRSSVVSSTMMVRNPPQPTSEITNITTPSSGNRMISAIVVDRMGGIIDGTHPVEFTLYVVVPLGHGWQYRNDPLLKVLSLHWPHVEPLNPLPGGHVETGFENGLGEVGGIVRLH